MKSVALLVAGAAAIVTMVSACDDLTGITREEFVIRIDSVSGPTAVSGGAPFDEFFWGTIGPTGCYQFKRFDTTRQAHQLDVTVIGEHRSARHLFCLQEVTRLIGAVFTVLPVTPDPFTIVVHQPDGTTLTKLIRAE